MKALLLIGIYLAVVLAPLALSWISGGPPRPFRHELASGLGMLAFAMILAEFVLSGRIKRISNGIGMDVTMRFHQVIARTALVFALLHPLLYPGSPSGGPRPWDASRQLTLTTDFWPLATGIGAFLLLPALVLLAIGRPHLDYRYEAWRLMHGVGALLIAGLLLHHTLNAGRYGAEPALTWLWAAMTAIAAGSLIYVYIGRPLRHYARPWTVSVIERLTPRQWRVVLDPVGHEGLSYEAGQFAWLSIGRSPFSLFENPFSISSAPAQGPQVEFVIKELGDFTGSLDQITPGTRAYLDAPYGNLSINGHGAPGVALVAGGVGIAPLLGILRQMQLTGDAREKVLIYGNRAQDQIICPEELDGFAGTKLVHVLSEPGAGWTGEVGLIDADLLDRSFDSDQITSWLFVLCGPPEMMDVVETHLIARGAPSDHILSERFTYD